MTRQYGLLNISQPHRSKWPVTWIALLYRRCYVYHLVQNVTLPSPAYLRSFPNTHLATVHRTSVTENNRITFHRQKCLELDHTGHEGPVKHQAQCKTAPAASSFQPCMGSLLLSAYTSADSITLTGQRLKLKLIVIQFNKCFKHSFYFLQQTQISLPPSNM